MIGMPMPPQVATILPRRAPRVRSGSIGSSPCETPADPARRPRILVVDDHHDSADSLSIILEALGYRTLAVYDGDRALLSGSEWRPDVAILDIGMPGMDGYELARRLRAEPWGKDMVLIALTGWAGEEHRRRAREAGFDRFLAKPASPDSLVGAIATLPTR